MEEETEDDELCPEPPQKPLDSDCCGTGCTPCVFDIYEKELALWEEECERIRSLGSKQDQCSEECDLSPDRYTSFEIEKISAETHDSNVYRFKIPDNGHIRLTVGQHLVIRSKLQRKLVTRQFTPIRCCRGYFDVVIKIYPEGEMSQCVRTWKEGDLIECRGPFGQFVYKPNSFRRIVMVAAGTGIAPMIPVIRTVLENEDDETFVTLLFGCRRYRDVLCKTLLDDWARYWNFSCVFALSKECRTGLNVRYGDEIRFGRIDESMLREAVADRTEGTLVLICGTKSFDKDMINYAKRCGVPEGNYFKF